MGFRASQKLGDTTTPVHETSNDAANDIESGVYCGFYMLEKLFQNEGPLNPPDLWALER